MKTRVPSVPLITCDPYFSVWSPADKLYDADTVHWTGRKQNMKGIASVDGKNYRFLGYSSDPVLDQKDFFITATSSQYRFEGAGIILEIAFLTPLLLDDIDLLSRPLSYISAKVRSADGKPHEVELNFSFDSTFCKMGDDAVPLVSGIHNLSNSFAAWMGQRKQAPLSHSGDDVSIDWGYLYLAIPEGQGRVFISGAGEALTAKLKFSVLSGGEPRSASSAAGSGAQEGFFAAAYDDTASINYFGETRRGYWARDGKTILSVIEEGIENYPSIKNRCAQFDAELNKKALASGGPDYQLITNLAYRQSIAAHKLIADEKGEALFISKECFSNGCAATVDISYPSTPLYLLYNPELVKGMLRPILHFSGLSVWIYDFAPHDAGRYPYVTGQVYGLKNLDMKNTEVYPHFYAFPANSDAYDPRYQMPVEECGNMIIMMAAVAKAEGNADFSKPYLALLEKWAVYLETYGTDPGEQLCTDDFAGHLAHNCNLAAKAIMGLEAFGLILDMVGDKAKAARYHDKAKTFAHEWTANTARGDHSALVFDKQDGWALKYNLVWDKLFGTKLFDDSLFAKEVQWYIKTQNKYGVPLDSRREYTKSDWILWTAAFTKDVKEREALIAPIAAFLHETPDRVPFSDWYDTISAKHYYFQNRTVQGGLFMLLLADEWMR
ncbi:glutaminase domain-containing protein [Leadbettera azotonutricia]|nr:DUF4965 domain-containing protein [Leadbettera azotonutricia]